MEERACLVGVPDTAQNASEHVFLANVMRPEVALFAICPSSAGTLGQYGATMNDSDGLLTHNDPLPPNLGEDVEIHSLLCVIMNFLACLAESCETQQKG